MLNIENKEDETMTDLVYVVFDPAGPYIQGVYTTTESAAIGARMAMEAEHIEHGDTVSIIASKAYDIIGCLLYTSPSPRDKRQSRMPSSA